MNEANRRNSYVGISDGDVQSLFRSHECQNEFAQYISRQCSIKYCELNQMMAWHRCFRWTLVSAVCVCVPSASLVALLLCFVHIAANTHRT